VAVFILVTRATWTRRIAAHFAFPIRRIVTEFIVQIRLNDLERWQSRGDEAEAARITVATIIFTRHWIDVRREGIIWS
jgi:hypothetical protein